MMATKEDKEDEQRQRRRERDAKKRKLEKEEKKAKDQKIAELEVANATLTAKVTSFEEDARALKRALKSES